ncbi:DnaA inactivator Hda (shorter homolog of DnaA) [hydrothermal vent metagenome]|uniref:DnaA inactivator Hda (Shorter homolog of DnaA) n=1 Tax=hydrothermal vent metagenome TaxID=652676 RepID=A0A3B1APQ4_9ZZZZ
MAYQIPLDIKLNATATFDNFVPARNEQLLDLLQGDESFVYLWAAEVVGKSHLLQALCQKHHNAIYLPLNEISSWQPEIFSGLESFDLICLDDVEHLAGQADWEQALFNLFNRVRDNHKRLCISGNVSATQLAIGLKDLSSRLTWGVSMQMHTLDDKDKIVALSKRAEQKGFSLSEEVSNFVLKNCPRDMKSLFNILEQLDDASLQAQRRVTIPFIKKQLGI